MLLKVFELASGVPPEPTRSTEPMSTPLLLMTSLYAACKSLSTAKPFTLFTEVTVPPASMVRVLELPSM